ncbi:phage tail tape measure protein [Janibacter melonis]|uniref:phage tail tape measure protein n=1 Tax=Janibacter melonis TaxID=262209 RepID=UPI0017870AC0|nr:phage tail tape measure protein [Janibacter melonis]
MSTARTIKAVLELDSNRYIAGMTRAKTATRDFSAAARGDFDRTRKGYDGMGSAVAGGGKYTAGLSRAKAATADFARSASRSTEQQRQAWDQMGNTALVAGGAIAGGLGLATREAINWESAWAGVTKTTNGSTTEMAELEGQLRGLTKVLPVTHEEIAGVAEAAGALGIARDDLVKFTEVAIGLGESTNLSAEDAATGLAKISNVMGTLDDEGVVGIERMGSALVALGNDGASTESDILAMAQRLSGAGDLIGATESDILAMSSALSSVGIESELGGGAMSRGLLEMNSAVISGTKELDVFAETAGMTAQEFTRAWQDDPIAAANAFVAGLGKVSSSGGDAAQVLKDVGLGGTQNAQVFLRAAGASELLTEQLKLGEDAYKSNTAARDEAMKRYETDASKLKIAQNGMRDAAIDLGSSLAPMAATLAGYVAGAADTFVKLPEPVQDTTAAVAGLTAGTLLLAGGFTRATTAVIGFKTAAEAAGVSSAALAGTAKTLGKALAVVGVAWGATEAKDWIKTQHLAGITADETTEGLIALANGGKTAAAGLDEMYRRGDGKWYQIFGDDEGPLSTADALDRFALSADAAFSDDWTAKADRFLDPGKMSKFSEEVSVFDAALAQMVREGNAGLAAASFEQLLSKVDPSQVERVKAEFTEYNGELENTKAAAEGAGGAVAGMAGDLDTNADGFVDATEAAAGYADEIEDLAGSITKMGGGFRAEQQAISDFDSAVQDASKAVSGTRDEQEAALRGIASSALEVAGAQIEMGRGADVVGASMTDARSKFLALAQSMGYSKPYAQELADAMGLIPRDVVAEVKAAGVQDSTAQVLKMKDSIELLSGKTVTVQEEGANPSAGRVKKMDGAIFGLEGKTVTVTEIGTTAAGERVVRFQGQVWKLTGTTVTIDAETGGATASLNALQAKINAMNGRTVTMTTRYVVEGKSTTGGIPLADGGLVAPGGPGLVRAYANGGFDGSFRTAQPQVRPAGGAGVLWAEEGAGPWEAFISGHPGKADRSKAIASDVVRMLGGQVSWNPDSGPIAGGDVLALASGGLLQRRADAAYKRLKRLDKRTRGSISIDRDEGTAKWSGSGKVPQSVREAIDAFQAAHRRAEAQLDRERLAAGRSRSFTAAKEARLDRAADRRREIYAQEGMTRRGRVGAERPHYVAQPQRVNLAGSSKSAAKTGASRMHPKDIQALANAMAARPVSLYPNQRQAATEIRSTLKRGTKGRWTDG